MSELSINAKKVLERRYLLRDGEEGDASETPEQMFRRVARAISAVEEEPLEAEQRFYNMMASLQFLPNSPTLMNAGTENGQLSACFVLPVEDSIGGIFGTLEKMVKIHRSGGGTGFSFSKLRPRGDDVKSTRGVASGPVSFIQIFDVATEVVKQGGKRRGANMGMLRIDHPDIIEFIQSKSEEGALKNFNLSVAVGDDFMLAVEGDNYYNLINPRTGSATESLKAREILDLIVEMAWKTGDPGLIFLDRINVDNPTPHIGMIESTNPCGEQPLLPYESCNLGSINLGKMVSSGKIDWDRLKQLVRDSVDFLDDVIEVNKFPLQKVKEMTKANRKIGLGVMGFADMLIRLGIPYNSDEALEVAEDVMKFIYENARERSRELGELRGNFPNFEDSIISGVYESMRNATTCTIAPTGTLSIIAGSSSGIEPLFAVAYVRDVLDGEHLLEVDSYFKELLTIREIFSEELLRKIARSGSIQGIPEIPEDIKKLFLT
ncbi:MAG: adenosylcobalamin-dependent ribonucleoside-diphosphate reductase, partial [Halobacteriota archaeon]|nr:adenosylcobalamin-dependent ribonucleoside-diphosphate reductase [Halobacteriota archaeon]